MSDKNPANLESGSRRAGRAGSDSSSQVTVADELYRLALYFARAAPGLTIEVPRPAASPNGDQSQPRRSDTDSDGVVQRAPVTVLQTLTKIREAVQADINLSRTCASERSRLLGFLGVDVLLEIFSYATPVELKRLMRVCSSMRKLLIGDEQLWQIVCASNYPCWMETFLRNGEPSRKTPPLVPGVAKWYLRLQAKEKSERLWFSHREYPPAVYERSLPRGLHCIYFDDRDLFCGSGINNEVVVLDMHSGLLRRTNGKSGLFGHTASVSSVHPVPDDPSLLITSSLDNTVRLWDRDAMQCRNVYHGHQDKVWCAEVCGDRVFSGGSDKTAKIWDLTSGNCVATLRDHRTSISALKAMRSSAGVTLATGSAGNTIRVWDINECSAICTSKLRGHEKGVFCLHMTPSALLSGSLDNTIKIWDPRHGYRLITTLSDNSPTHSPDSASGRSTPTHPSLQTSEEKTGIITFCVDDTKVVSGGPDQTLKLWDLRMFRLVDKFPGHSHWVTSVQFDDDKIVSASRDRTLRFWDLTGRMLETVHLPLPQ